MTRIPSYISTEVQDPHARSTKASFGGCLVVQARYANAESLLVDGYARLARGSVDRRPVARTALRDLVTLYSTWGKPEKVAEYRRLLVDTTAAP